MIPAKKQHVICQNEVVAIIANTGYSSEDPGCFWFDSSFSMVILCLLLLALVIPSEAIPKLEKYIRKYKPITSVEGTRT
ncbi:hypothetical protein Y032_0663g1306 [Ancylostoma ceylanicum]|uniref:Uncharacterized protein n=1 Tax=Ancylostoma ceylanicum TaxID=53326 RepID=A0A016WJ41_9BILA|nr:hypothetical protein Y032_0663g1306 [Ancylostoma ceylanicum]